MTQHGLCTARIDLGKIYNATDIEVYFGWRAQAQKPGDALVATG